MRRSTFTRSSGTAVSSSHRAEAIDDKPAGTAVDGDTVGRRGFLRWVSGIAAAVSAAVVGVPVIRALLSPVFEKPRTDSWVKVADDIALLDVGVPIRVNFVQSGRRLGGEPHAQRRVALHRRRREVQGVQRPLHASRAAASRCRPTRSRDFLCPCHRGQFDVKTGAVLAGPPPRPLDELAVEIRDSAVFVQYRDFRLGIPERVEA